MTAFHRSEIWFSASSQVIRSKRPSLLRPARRSGWRSRSLDSGHGLEATAWSDLLTEPAAVPDLAVSTAARGTFPELARVTGNAERCRLRREGYPREAVARSANPAVEPGTSLTLKEILGQIPDVADLYERTFGEHGRRLRCEVQLTDLPVREPGGPFLVSEVPPDREEGSTRGWAWSQHPPGCRRAGGSRACWGRSGSVTSRRAAP